MKPTPGAIASVPITAKRDSAYAAADALVGEVVDRLLPDWKRTVLIVLSDHGMEEARRSYPVDLLAAPAVQAAIDGVLADGGSALARVRAGASVAAAGAALRSVAGVSGWREMRPGVLLVAGEPGVRFAAKSAKSVLGVHGGPGSTTTLALVAGGHPSVRGLAAAVAARPPHLADWAPTIAALFGIPFPSAEGRNLLHSQRELPGPSPQDGEDAVVLRHGGCVGTQSQGRV